MIDAGKALVESLDQAGFPVDAALWILAPESGSWRLVIGSSKVGSKGHRPVYMELLHHVIALNNPALSLSDITVVGINDALITLLKTALRTGRKISGIHFTRNTIKGVVFPDAYVYRVA
jgi:hypothetical protein